eukprot:6213965-Pleurochrysis_carterae.AAC.2
MPCRIEVLQIGASSEPRGRARAAKATAGFWTKRGRFLTKQRLSARRAGMPAHAQSMLQSFLLF